MLDRLQKEDPNVSREELRATSQSTFRIANDSTSNATTLANLMTSSAVTAGPREVRILNCPFLLVNHGRHLSIQEEPQR